MGRGGCSGLCGLRLWTLMIFVGPFPFRVLHDFDSRAVPACSCWHGQRSQPQLQPRCHGQSVGTGEGAPGVTAGPRLGSQGPGAGLGWEGRRQGWVGRDPVQEMMYGQMYQIAQDKQAVNFIRAHHGFNLAA